MRNTYSKLVLRGVRDSFARFMSILAIVAVGTGFLSGLLATTPDMQLTVDNYYDENRMFDIYVRSTLGLTDDDVEALGELDSVETVMPAKVSDLIMDTDNGSYVTRAYGIDFDKYGTDEFLNSFEIIEGRLPDKSDECIVVVPNEYSEKHEIGEVLTISEDNRDYDTIDETYSEKSLTIVGIIRHPQYMSINIEPSTVGTGEVSIIAYTPMEFYSLEAYTDIYLTVTGARELNAFSSEYTSRVNEVVTQLEEFGIERSEIRYNELVDDANEAIEEAKADYAQAEQDVNEELADALQEIEDGQKEIDDAKAELNAARAELAEARDEIDSGREQLEAAKNDYYSGVEQINSARAELESRRSEIEAGKAEIAAGREEIEAARSEIETGRAQLAPYEQLINDAKEDYAALGELIQTLEAQLEEMNESGSASEEDIKALEERIAGLKTDYAEAEAQISAYERDYGSRLAEILEAEGACNAAEAELDSLEVELLAGEEQINAAAAELDANESYLLSTWDQIAANEQELENAEAEIAAGEQELAAGAAEIAENEALLADAREEYEDGRLEAEQELEDARQEIADGEADIAEISEGEWYLFTREDTVSYTSYKSDSEKIEAISTVFPLFFFLVAALVALTTMTRMVEEERTQIGTLKALGYSNGMIRMYYIGYSVTASLAGGIIGVSAGFKTLPAVISNAYSMMYALPETIMPFMWGYALVIIFTAVLCTTLATISACTNQLKEKPAMLMQQRVPVAGKRILLERIPFIWRRLKFTHKVTARNVFRYKKRLFMTVIGIAGCSALLVTGFALRDSIRDIVEKQYNDIQKYNLTVYLSESDVLQKDEILSDFFEDPEYIESYVEVHYESGSAEVDGESVETYIYVPKTGMQLKEHFALKERESGQEVEFNEDSIIMTEKMCELLDVSVGDTVTLINGDGETAQFTLTGIIENYIYNYVFMNAGMYEENFENPLEYNMILARLTEDYENENDVVSEMILESDNILLLQFADTVKVTFENTVENIDYIVGVLILAAGVLAIIVMYNLTNINICERKKELATIKVLGFYKEEVAGYIYRETTILSIIGTVAGFVLGVWLHRFVVMCAEVDSLMFGRDIRWTSFLYAGIATLAFTALVDVLMYRKLAKIDMAESMKANE